MNKTKGTTKSQSGEAMHDGRSDAAVEEAAAMDAEGNMRAAKDKAETEANARSQSEKFVHAAREMGLDEREEAFDAALTKVARHKPSKIS